MTAPNAVRLPAEWEPQAGVMLTWPDEATDWHPWLAEVEALYRRLAREIARRQHLVLVCRDDGHRRRVEDLLLQDGIPPDRLTLIRSSYDDTWIRDYGPLTVIDQGRLRLLDFRFNGWGGKFSARHDDQVTATLYRQGLFADCALQPVDFILEGGAVETDGAGTLLATRSSIIDRLRNPGKTQRQVEETLRTHLGLKHFLWLSHGHLSGDDTDGHIDTLARFADPGTILYVTAHPNDPDADELAAMALELKSLRDREGHPYRLFPLPPARPQQDETGRRLPASYANFLIIDGAVLAPVYGDAADEPAMETLAHCFPGREIVPLDCRPLIRQNGSLHCITMQLPLGALKNNPESGIQQRTRP